MPCCCFKFSPDEKIVPCNRQTLAFWYDCATISTLNDSGYGVFIWKYKIGYLHIFEYLWKDKTYQSSDTDSLMSCWSWEVASISTIKTFLFLSFSNYGNWKCCATQRDMSKWIAIVVVMAGLPRYILGRQGSHTAALVLLLLHFRCLHQIIFWKIQARLPWQIYLPLRPFMG